MSEETKLCGACAQRKLRADFDESPRVKDGLFSWCRACRKAHNENFYKRNKDRILKKYHTKKALEREELAKKEARELEIARLQSLIKPGKRNSLKEYKKMMKNTVITVSDLVD